MLCDNYTNLTPVDKVTYIGELIHACQCDNELFEHGELLIEFAKRKGIFDGVVILPPKSEE